MSKTPEELDEVAKKVLSQLEQPNRQWERIERGIRFIAWAQAGIIAGAIWLALLQAKVSAISKDVEEQLPHVRELWWMKESGLSNKEAFERKNGYPAPNQKSP